VGQSTKGIAETGLTLNSAVRERFRLAAPLIVTQKNQKTRMVQKMGRIPCSGARTPCSAKIIPCSRRVKKLKRSKRRPVMHGRGSGVVSDFRVTCPEARFSANFTRLGFHPGFGLTTTLPTVVGPTKAALMFYTSRRVTGEDAFKMGLADVLVPQDQVRSAALALAAEIAASAGVVTNCSAQVVDQRQAPMPGLYAAGNNSVHTEYGVGYQAGFSLGSAMTFGYLAARHMASLN
jgi:hypothetical protein